MVASFQGKETIDLDIWGAWTDMPVTPLAEIKSFEESIAEVGKRVYLLLGNGFSIGCDPVFKYSSLYEAAVQAGLSTRAQEVFGRVGTNNFEGVLRLLEDTDWVARKYGLLPSGKSEIQNDIEVSRNTLITAVAANHLEHTGSVSDSQKIRANKFLENFQSIFTTNYDLLAYWVVMSRERVAFQDGFREDEPGDPFVIFSQRLGDTRGLFYLHGALHLYLASGELRKHCWNRTSIPLTKLIRDGLADGNYPLFVAEGTAEQKLEQIQRVGYLWYCMDKFSRIKSPLVVYGHSLGPSDEHIVQAIGRNTELAILYLGIHGGTASAAASKLWNAAQRILGIRKEALERKKGNELLISFYDSESAQVWN
jgi:hypothetical protein